MKPLRICIDARLKSGHHGGVEQVVIGLASGLTTLTDGDEQYFYLVNRGDEGWLQPYLASDDQLLYTQLAPATRGKLQTRLERVPGVQRLRAMLSNRLVGDYRPPTSDGTIEQAAIDVMHFTWQSAFLTDVPTIYHPHDLQHIHLPQFFNKRHRHQRDQQFRTFCEQAQMVAAATSWTKRDFIQQYKLADANVQVVPLAPPITEYGEISAEIIAETRHALQLPNQFIFYPAQTWPHKNHLNLFEALAQLRDRHNLRVDLMLTGRQNDHAAVLHDHLKRLDLEQQVRFLGFVSTTQLKALYELASAVVLPTRFEAGSFPMWEAFASGTPVACSTVTSLPELAQDAALLFDPDDVDGIATAVRRIVTEPDLAQMLVARGRERVALITWARTARHFRAHYRRLANRPLSAEDAAILAAPPLM